MRKFLGAAAIGATLLTAMPAMARTDAKVNTDLSFSNQNLTSTQLQCMSTAVLAREDAVIAARTTFHTSIMAALSARRTSLQAAYALSVSTERQAAIKASLSAYNQSTKTAKKTYSTSINTAWKTFMTAAVACGATTSSSSSSSNSSSSAAWRDGRKGNNGLHLGQWKKAFDMDMKMNGDARIDLSF